MDINIKGFSPKGKTYAENYEAEKHERSVAKKYERIRWASKIGVVDMISEHIISCPRLPRVFLIIVAHFMRVSGNRHTSP